MPQIFISYRRDDSGYVAGMLCQRLQNTFGPQSVFIDIDNIPLGVDFRSHLSDAVSKCDILLAVIGDSWLGAVPGSSERRIDNPTDFVRIEVEAALARDIPVVPVLVGNATLPTPNILPDALQALAFRNAAEVRPGRELNFHIESLVRGLQAHFTPPSTALPSKPKAVEDDSRSAPKPNSTSPPSTGLLKKEPYRQSRLQVTRVRRWAQALRSISIYVNGMPAGQLWNGGSIDVPVSTGDVCIDMKLGTQRVSHSLVAKEGEILQISCEIGESGNIVFLQ